MGFTGTPINEEHTCKCHRYTFAEPLALIHRDAVNLAEADGVIYGIADGVDDFDALTLTA